MTWEDWAIWIIQLYWVIWLAGSFIFSMILGGIIFRNYGTSK